MHMHKCVVRNFYIHNGLFIRFQALHLKNYQQLAIYLGNLFYHKFLHQTVNLTDHQCRHLLLYLLTYVGRVFKHYMLQLQ